MKLSTHPSLHRYQLPWDIYMQRYYLHEECSNMTACGLRLDNDYVRLAVGLRLDAVIMWTTHRGLHVCACGDRIDAAGPATFCPALSAPAEFLDTTPSIIYTTPIQRQGSHLSKRTVRSIEDGLQKTMQTVACGSWFGVGCDGGRHSCALIMSRQRWRAAQPILSRRVERPNIAHF